MMSEVLTREDLEAARAERYRWRPTLRVRTEEEALEFLNSVGLCLLFSAKELELPSLWGAICGQDRPAPVQHNDYELGLAWRWKDSLPISKRVLYGKFLHKRPVFVSLELAPYLYALSPNYGDPAEDTMLDYSEGRLSVEAKQVYEVLLQQGALPTSQLRREAGLGGKANVGRFDRALTELQMDLRIVKVAISDANRWGYCYVYDLLPRHLPHVVEEARTISGRRAREQLLRRYLQTVVAAAPQQIARLFGWSLEDIEQTADHLAERGELCKGVRIQDVKDEFFQITA